MDFEKYKNTKPYPERVREPRLVSQKPTDEQIIAYQKAKEEYSKKLETYNKQVKEYQEEDQRIMEQFWKDAFEDVGIPFDHPKASKISEIAWNQGHSSGFYEVYHWLEELSELII